LQNPEYAYDGNRNNRLISKFTTAITSDVYRTVITVLTYAYHEYYTVDLFCIFCCYFVRIMLCVNMFIVYKQHNWARCDAIQQNGHKGLQDLNHVPNNQNWKKK